MSEPNPTPGPDQPAERDPAREAARGRNYMILGALLIMVGVVYVTLNGLETFMWLLLVVGALDLGLGYRMVQRSRS